MSKLSSEHKCRDPDIDHWRLSPLGREIRIELTNVKSTASIYLTEDELCEMLEVLMLLKTQKIMEA